jgi:hypothetical protein
MADDIGESITTTKTFCFASGEILTLDEDQIQKIPYLTAIVSSGDHLESSRDENGHYKLDRGINYKHFFFALESLTFHSVRQLLTRLPEQNDIIPIIALLDFLGIGPEPDPTLKEVDLIFFYNLVYSPLLKKYIQIVRPCVIRDMIVRFAFAMAKEEYDFSKREIIDQIYWFIMFILSAHKLFEPRLRYHVYKIAEHCFSLFKPSLLKPLNKLIEQTDADARKCSVIINEETFDDDEENNRPLEQVLNGDNFSGFDFLDRPTLKQRQELLLCRKYSDYAKYPKFWLYETVKEESLLEPIHKRVLEIMYERLQSEICQRAVMEIRRQLRNFVPKVCNKWTSYTMFQIEPLWKLGLVWMKNEYYLPQYDYVPTEIDKQLLLDIFEYKPVQNEIRERILEEIHVLIPKLEQKHNELLKEIQEYEQNLGVEYDIHIFLWHEILLYGKSRFEYIQEEALSYELTIAKLHQCSTAVEQIYQVILERLYATALVQIKQWDITEQIIDQLRRFLSKYQSSKKTSETSKEMHKNYRIPSSKPLPKIQPKHSKR